MLPFNIPFRSQKQDEYLTLALGKNHLQGDGDFCNAASKRLSQILDCRNILLTPSASHALELAFFAMNPGDEVIIPSYNFPSAANAVLRGGGVPVFCDIDAKTQNIDPQSALSRVTERTRAICITHYAGISCDMDALYSIAREKSLILVEDAAQSIGSSYRGRPLGSIGDFSCISFHSTKNITCGEGGAYIHNSEAIPFELQRTRRNKGTDRSSFNPKVEEFYHWNTAGTSHIMPELSAALLMAQLEELDAVTARRLKLVSLYDELLSPLFQSGRISKMHIPDYAAGNGHIYYILCRDREDKQKIRAAMADRNFPLLPHFEPLHLGGMGHALGYKRGDFPVSESTAERLLRLPIYCALDEGQAEQICQALIQVTK